MQTSDEYYLIPKEAITTIREILDAANEAIHEVWSRVALDQWVDGVQPLERAFYERHAAVVHAEDLNVDEIF